MDRTRSTVGKTDDVEDGFLPLEDIPVESMTNEEVFREVSGIKRMIARIIETAIVDLAEQNSPTLLRNSARAFLLDRKTTAFGCTASALAEILGIGGAYWERIRQDALAFARKRRKEYRDGYRNQNGASSRVGSRDFCRYRADVGKSAVRTSKGSSVSVLLNGYERGGVDRRKDRGRNAKGDRPVLPRTGN